MTNTDTAPHARRTSRRLRTALCLALLTAGCGGSDGAPDGSSREAANVRAGGMATVLAGAFPDSLDPQLATSTTAAEALAQAYPGLLTFPHERGRKAAEIVPGLAEAMPEVSDDDRTYRFRLREGLRYSDGSPVKASDFEATAKRLLDQDSVGSGFGWLAITGAKAYTDEGQDDIAGIVTDDRERTIEIALEEPRGSFPYEMALWFASPVPAGTPASDQTRKPPPGTGRYVISDVTPGRRYALVKNPNFSPSLEGTAVDAGKLVTVNVEVERNQARAVDRVAADTADFLVEAPSSPRLLRRFRDRYRVYRARDAASLFMNPAAAPFDDPQVRRAVAFATGGWPTGRIEGSGPATILIGPVPDARDARPRERPDVDRGRRLVEAVGATGEEVTVLGPDEDSARRTVEHYAGVLDQIGLDATVEILPTGSYASVTRRAQAGWVASVPVSGRTFMSRRLDFATCSGEHPVWIHDWSQFCLK